MEFIFCVLITSITILCFLAMLPKHVPPKQPPAEFTPRELLDRMTYLNALSGDKASRDWVMKNMFQPEVSTEEEPSQTPKEEVEDAILALSKIGYKKSDAKVLVNKVVQNKTFNTSQQIILEVMRKK